MKKIVLLFVMVIILSGCITKEGLVIPIGDKLSKEDIADFHRRNDVVSFPPMSLYSKDIVRTSLVSDSHDERIIVVGNVLALTQFDESMLNQRYETLLELITATSEKLPFTKKWYYQTCFGETSVKYAGITGIYFRRIKANVPKDLVGQVNYASAFNVFMFGMSGDLVAAQITDKGIWVTHVLCHEKDKDYSACEAQYERGLFQGVDGKEIDNRFRVKKDGSVIDLGTFKRKLPAGSSNNSNEGSKGAQLLIAANPFSTR